MTVNLKVHHHDVEPNCIGLDMVPSGLETALGLNTLDAPFNAEAMLDWLEVGEPEDAMHSINLASPLECTCNPEHPECPDSQHLDNLCLPRLRLPSLYFSINYAISSPGLYLQTDVRACPPAPAANPTQLASCSCTRTSGGVNGSTDSDTSVFAVARQLPTRNYAKDLRMQICIDLNVCGSRGSRVRGFRAVEFAGGWMARHVGEAERKKMRGERSDSGTAVEACGMCRGLRDGVRGRRPSVRLSRRKSESGVGATCAQRGGGWDKHEIGETKCIHAVHYSHGVVG
ncbi:hypothetical protein DFH06DRAFT_1320220 [Mycena polygramma]|nr:hypothetical protein DFH06DRAFT_1320220 [Mycena polygramma]